MEFNLIELSSLVKCIELRNVLILIESLKSTICLAVL